MNYKIKRFLKRIIRAIILFGVVACFSFSCFASTYNNFSDFMTGSRAEGYLYDQDGWLSNSFPAEDMGDYDTIYINSPGAGYGGSLDIMWFGGLELRYTNGINFKTSYVKGDYILLQHQLYIATYQPYDISGTLGDFQLDLNGTSIQIYTSNDNGITSVGNYVGRSFVKSVTYDEWYDDQGSLYKSMLIDISLKQPLPKDSNEIYGISYVFPSMFTGESIYFNLHPSNNSSVYFDVGDPATFPTFPDFSNNSTLEEEEALSEELRTDAMARFGQGFRDIATTTGNVIMYPSFNNGLVAASSLINEFLFDVDTTEDITVAPSMIRNFLWISLTIGLCIFVLNIGVPLAVRAFGNSKKGGD